MLSLASPSVLSLASAAPAQFLPLIVARRAPPARCVSFFDGDEAEEEAYLAELEEQLLRTTGRRRGAAASSSSPPPPPTTRRPADLASAPPGAITRGLFARFAPAADRLLGGDGAPRPRDRTSRRGARVASVPGKVSRAYQDYLNKPGQPLLLGALALVFGFYLAGSLSTIFGAAGLWEPTIALFPLAVTEAITHEYYTRRARDRSQTLKLLNAMKIGWYFGIVLDALKLAG